MTTDTSPIAVPLHRRIAGAPISWGVCEVPGWGHQLSPHQVLGDMRELGLGATEFGPVGFLGSEPPATAQLLADHGMSAVGGFLPVVLHRADHDPIAEVDSFIETCLATGAGVVVLAAATGTDGYDARPELDEDGWATLLANLDRVRDHASSRGMLACLHPHVGTMVETGEETERVLAGSRVGLCLDTGHLLVGRGDPVAIAAAHPDRVVHVHLKDVDAGVAAQVGEGALTFGEAVRAGMFVPLGQGDLDIAAMVRTLEKHGYQGWYVLEQDVMLDDTPGGEGPKADVRACLDYVLGIADGTA